MPFFEQIDAHDSEATAQSIDGDFYSNAQVPGQPNTILPRIKITGDGDGRKDYFEITITSSSTNRNAFILITNADGDPVSFNGEVAIFKSGDAETPIGSASSGQVFQFPTTGTYYIKVTGTGDAVLPGGTDYALNLYIPGKSTVFAFTGSFGVSDLPETKADHDDISTAQNLDFGRWSLNDDPNITQAETIPHITITGTGDGRNDFYRFTITDPMLSRASGNLQVILDMDNSFDDGDQIFWRGRLVLSNEAGDVIVAGNGRSDPSLGAGPDDDNFFNDYITHTFETGDAGTYYIEVSDAVKNQGLPQDVTYELNVSVEGQEVDSFIFIPEPVLENDTGNNGVITGDLINPITGDLETIDLKNVDKLNFSVDATGQVIPIAGPPAIESGNFFTLPSDTVGNTDFIGGGITSNTPYVRIAGQGDSARSYDVFAFEITEAQLNPPTTVSSVGTDATLGDGTFFKSVTLSLGDAGSARDGDVWSLGLRNRTYTETVDLGVSARDSLLKIANLIKDQLPARYTVDAYVDAASNEVILKIDSDSGFNLDGVTSVNNGLNLRPRVSGSVTASVNLDKDNGDLANLHRAEITLSGAIVPGESISFNGASILVESGDSFTSIATRIAASSAIATAVGATVTSDDERILFENATTAFTLSTITSGVQTGVIMAANVTVAPGDLSGVTFDSLAVTLTGPSRVGEKWGITIGSDTVDYTPLTNGNANLTKIAEELADQIGGVSAAGGVLTATNSTFGGVIVTPSGASNIQGSAASGLIFESIRVVPATSNGQTWVVELLDGGAAVTASTSFTVTDASLEDQETVAEMLAGSLAGSLAVGAGYAAVAVDDRIIVSGPSAATFSLNLYVSLDGVTSTDLRAETYDLDLASNAPVATERWTLRIAGGGGDIATAIVTGTPDIVDDLVADTATNANFKLVRGPDDKVTLIQLTGDSNFDVELVIDDGNAPATVALGSQDVRAETYDLDLASNAPVATETWTLRIAGGGGDIATAIVTGTPDIVDDLVADTATNANFKLVRGPDDKVTLIQLTGDSNFDVELVIDDGNAPATVALGSQDVSTDLRAETYDLDLASNAPVATETWTLRIAGGGGDIATAIVTGTPDIVDDLVADTATNANFKLVRGPDDKVTLIQLTGDSNFDVELVIDDGNAPATVALTAAPGSQDVKRVAFTGTVPGAAWRLEIDGAGGGTFLSQTTSTAATLPIRLNELGVLTGDFSGHIEGFDLLVLRNSATDFDVRIMRDTIDTSQSGTVAVVTFSGEVYSDVDWSLSLGSPGTDATYSAAASSEESTDAAADFATQVSGFAGFSAVAGSSTVTIFRNAGGVITPTFTKAFNPATTSSATHRGTLGLEYSQALELSPAFVGDNSVNSGDRWTLTYTDADGAKSLESSGQGSLKINNAASFSNITNATNLTELASRFTTPLTVPAGLTATASTNGIVDIKQSNGAPVIFDAIAHNRKVVARDGSRADASITISNLYKELTIELDGSWTNEQVWTVVLDGTSYPFTTPTEEIPGKQRLSRIATGLAEEINTNPPEGLEAVPLGKTLTIRQTTAVDTQAGVDVDNPFLFDISRGSGTIRVVLDIDDANEATGSESFTYQRRADGFRGLLGYSVTETDFVDFTSTVTADLYREDRTLVTADLDRTNNAAGIVDQGSNQISDVFKEFVIGAGENLAGRYYVVIGSKTEYDAVSNRGGIASPFIDSNGGVTEGLVYTANISIENQPSNINELNLAGARIELAEGAGAATSPLTDNQSDLIQSYDPVTKTFVVAQSNNWIVSPDSSTRFDIFETATLPEYADNVITDNYTLRLSGEPTGTVTVDLLPERTRTYNSDEAFNPVVYYGEQSEEQVRVATKQAIIRVIDSTTTTWSLTLRDLDGVVESFTGSTLAALALDVNGSDKIRGQYRRW